MASPKGRASNELPPPSHPNPIVTSQGIVPSLPSAPPLPTFVFPVILLMKLRVRPRGVSSQLWLPASPASCPQLPAPKLQETEDPAWTIPLCPWPLRGREIGRSELSRPGPPASPGWLLHSQLG